MKDTVKIKFCFKCYKSCKNLQYEFFLGPKNWSDLDFGFGLPSLIVHIFFKVGYNEDADLSSGNLKFYDTPAPMDIMDDFFLIAQETEKRDTQVSKQTAHF